MLNKKTEMGLKLQIQKINVRNYLYMGHYVMVRVGIIFWKIIPLNWQF